MKKIETPNTSKVKVTQGRRYNEARIGEKIKEEKDLENLRYNLLLIREAYRMLHSDTQSMKQFYEALDVDADSYTLFLTTGYISTANHTNLMRTLIDCGISKKYLSKTRPSKIYSSKILESYFGEYIDEYASKEAKDEAIIDIRTELGYDWYRNKDKIAMLVMGVYILGTKISGHTEADLRLASDTLEKVIHHDFSESTLKSNAFGSFITELAKSVNKVEEEFPEFYAVAQQMKEDKSAQSIMNEISNNLKSLNNMVLTESDTKSDSCINMLKEISETMKNIYSKME